MKPNHVRRFIENIFLLRSDEQEYLLHDEDGEKLYGMSLPQSIDRAQAKPLFQVGERSGISSCGLCLNCLKKFLERGGTTTFEISFLGS